MRASVDFDISSEELMSDPAFHHRMARAACPVPRLDGRIALRVLTERIASVWLRERPEHVKLYQTRGVNRLVVSWNERE